MQLINGVEELKDQSESGKEMFIGGIAGIIVEDQRLELEHGWPRDHTGDLSTQEGIQM